MKGENEKLVVKNLFDESDEFDINDPLFVQNVLKQKAALNINTTEAEALASSSPTKTSDVEIEEAKEQSKYADLSDEELVDQVSNQADELLSQAEVSEIQTNRSYQIATEKSNEAQELYNQSKKLIEEAEQAPTQEEKDLMLDEAETNKQMAAQLINEAAVSFNIARTLENETVERESDVEKIKQIKENINNDIAIGDRSSAEENASKLEQISESSYQQQSALEIEKNRTAELLKEKESIYFDDRDRVSDLNNRKYDLTETINKLEEKKKTAKKSEQEDIDQRINVLKIDIEDTDYELIKAREKEATSYKEYVKAKNNNYVANDIFALVEANQSDAVSIEESQKIALENSIAYFENEGLIGGEEPEQELVVIEPTPTDEAVEQYNLIDHKDEYSIVDDEGDITNYNLTFSNKLVDADELENEVDKNNAMIQINQDWVESIDQEIDIRENQLAGVSDNNEKNRIRIKISFIKRVEIFKRRRNSRVRVSF